jgi:hypothetical protein
VEWHLNATVSGKGPPPLQMILYGEGGTGKSKIIQMISALFAQRGMSNLLQKTAYTGVAASLIDGQTMHTLCGMSVKQRGRMSMEAKRWLEETWGKKLYLIIDECSMISKSFLQKFAMKIKQGHNSVDDEDWWGGLNVIICGDFHQFPPVAVGRNEYLFMPTKEEGMSHSKVIGGRIYEEFQTVIILKEQKRVHDKVWLQFLRRLRHGSVSRDDISMLRSLIMSPSTHALSDGDSWRTLSMITPRHAVRTLWNEEACREMCCSLGQTLFICPALDSIGERPLTSQQRLKVTPSLMSNKMKVLPDEVELAVGMKILVTYNVETDVDITNGARGTIVRIVLDPRESILPKQAIHHLKYLPKYILVRLDRTRMSKLSGLDDNIVPVEPMTMPIEIRNGKDGSQMKLSIKRTQFPLTGGYAFTDYRSQGQTISQAIVVIAPPPRGMLTLFNLYVALSRCPSRNDICLLHDFDPDMLLKAHDENLLRADERLEHLNDVTRRWWQRLGERES